MYRFLGALWFERLFCVSLELSPTFEPSAHEQSTKAKKHEARLAPNDIPKKARRFVPIDFAERSPRGTVEQVHKLRIVSLLKVMQRSADQPVGSQLAAQRRQFLAPASLENGLPYGQRSPQARYDSADG